MLAWYLVQTPVIILIVLPNKSKLDLAFHNLSIAAFAVFSNIGLPVSLDKVPNSKIKVPAPYKKYYLC